MDRDVCSKCGCLTVVSVQYDKSDRPFQRFIESPHYIKHCGHCGAEL